MTTRTAVLDCVTCHGTLAIAGVNLHTPAWCIADLSDLFSDADYRGSNRLIPGTAGVLGFPRRRTETRMSFPMVIAGGVDRSGVAYANAEVGLRTNIDYLEANVTAPVESGDGTRSAVWTLAGGGTRTASVQVAPLKVRLRPGNMALATLELTVPSGRFV